MTKKDIIKFLSNDKIPDGATIVFRDGSHNILPITFAIALGYYYKEQIVLSATPVSLTPFELDCCLISVKTDNDKEGTFTNSE